MELRLTGGHQLIASGVNEGEPDPIRVEVLGPMRVLGRTVDEPTSKAQRRLLAILALGEGGLVGIDRLIDSFWGDELPANPKASLQIHISRLRAALGADTIVTGDAGYGLSVERATLDLVAFHDHTNLARAAIARQDWEEALAAASSASRLWRGLPFPELDGDEFAQSTITGLEESYLLLREWWAEALMATDRAGEATPELERLAVEHPYRERLWELLMLARHRSGRHAEALDAYRELYGRLTEVGLEPGPSIARTQDKILRHVDALGLPPSNLPPSLTSFVGREAERGEVASLLREHRLVTLTGTGGAGKTRLAVRVATDTLTKYPDGCWFVNLAEVLDANRVALEVAQAMGIRADGGDPMDAVVRQIRGDSRLIILDNCEHLLPAVAEVVRELLGATDEVAVLATTRERLGVPGEVTFEVPPLAAPSADAAEADLRSFDAVRLFLDRAVLRDRGLAGDRSALGSVANICRMVDGIPLAIELAAAKVGTFPLGEIEERLGSRLSMLTSRRGSVPRHATMAAAIDWSHDLLTDSERGLFAELSLFRGTFDLEMAEVVGGVDGHAFLTTFEGLVEKSMVIRDSGIDGRYRLLVPVREYAAVQLSTGVRADAAHRRLVQWAASLACSVDGGVRMAHPEHLARILLDAENLEVGLDLAREVSESTAISQIASALAWRWWHLDHYDRVVDLLTESIVHRTGRDHVAEAGTRSRIALAHFGSGDTAAASAEAEAARELLADSDPSAATSVVLRRLAAIYSWTIGQDPRLAVALAREAVAVAESHGASADVSHARSDLGEVLCRAGHVDEGLAALGQALDQMRVDGDLAAYPLIHKHLFSGLMMHPTQRRHGPLRIADQALEAMPLRTWDRQLAAHNGWLAAPYIQTGQWHVADAVLERLSEELGAEGFMRVGQLIRKARLCWMRSDFESAEEVLSVLDRIDINQRWFHLHHPLRAEIAADLGDIDSVDAWAERFLSSEVDPSEEALKLSVLSPVVRAHVDAALRGSGAGGADHEVEARAAEQRMRGILEAFPPLSGGAMTPETPQTHLAFATAELSRLVASDPVLWMAAAERADTVHQQLYAQIRRAEAVAASGSMAEGRGLLDALASRATELGAGGLVRLAEDLRDGLDVV